MPAHMSTFLLSSPARRGEGAQGPFPEWRPQTHRTLRCRARMSHRTHTVVLGSSLLAEPLPPAEVQLKKPVTKGLDFVCFTLFSLTVI